jgi:hypothetical protein
LKGGGDWFIAVLVQRWNSQRSNIHRLAYILCKYLSILGLAYEFFPKVLDFFLLITNIGHKS